MTRAGTVVVGVDGSETAKAALVWAIDQAVAERRALTVVHAAANPSPLWMDLAAVNLQAAWSALQAAGQEVLAEARAVVHRRAPGLEVESTLDVADPRQALLERSRGAHLLVVGARGLGPVRRLLLGSTGAALARHAECPLVVHRVPPDRGAPRSGVLVAADARPESAPVLDFAYRHASLHALPLTVLHTHWDPELLFIDAETATARREEERLLLAEATAGLAEKYPDVVSTRVVSVGSPAARVAAAEEDADLLVVGAHQDGWVRRLALGSTSHLLLEHAEVPVAVVPVGRSAGEDVDRDGDRS